MPVPPVAPERLSDYRTAVDSALTALCGVSYTTLVEEMAPAMDRDGVFLLTAAAKGIDAERFAGAFAKAHSLALVGRGPAGWAENFNLHRAALMSFGSEARGWRLGTDGRAYLGTDSGALRLDIAFKELEGRSKWGFAVSEAAGPVTIDIDPADPFRRVTPPAAAFQKLSARLDVGDAISDAMRLLAERRMGNHTQPVAAPAPEPAEDTPAVRRLG